MDEKQLRGKQKLVYQLIKNAGLKGINTNDLRNITHAVDVPKIVSELNKKGFRITSQRLKDGTANYSLSNTPKNPKYIFVGDRAIPIYE